jgi:hypothetical protein
MHNLLEEKNGISYIMVADEPGSTLSITETTPMHAYHRKISLLLELEKL